MTDGRAPGFDNDGRPALRVAVMVCAAVLVLSDIGASIQDGDPIGDLILDDEAVALLPEQRAEVVPGRYRPTNYGSGDTFPTPAPIIPEFPYSLLGHMDGGRPSGDWSLYAMNDTEGGNTRIASRELRIKARVRR